MYFNSYFLIVRRDKNDGPRTVTQNWSEKNSPKLNLLFSIVDVQMEISVLPSRKRYIEIAFHSTIAYQS